MELDYLTSRAFPVEPLGTLVNLTRTEAHGTILILASRKQVSVNGSTPFGP
jgi:hypothetical protein